MYSHYFCANGDYGPLVDDAYDAIDWQIIVPTWSWNDTMLQLIATTDGSKRLKLAKHFNVGVHIIKDGKCTECKLNSAELDGQNIVDPNTTRKDDDLWVSVEPVYSDGASQTCW